MTDIEFTKEGKYYIGSFTATGDDVFVYINRMVGGFLSVASTPDADDCRPCTDYANIHENKDVCIKTAYPNGVTVIIKSETPVEYAATTIEGEEEENAAAK